MFRKKYLYEEIINVLNKIQKVEDPIYFVLGLLEELLSSDNDVYISHSAKLGMNWNELRDANDRYIST